MPCLSEMGGVLHTVMEKYTLLEFDVFIYQGQKTAVFKNLT